MANNITLITLLICFIGGLLVWLYTKRGFVAVLREPAAVQAISIGVQRATEMGRPVIYSPGRAGVGLSSASFQTIASLPILSHISKLCAEQGTNLHVGVCNATSIPYLEETLRLACIEAGKPEAVGTKQQIFYFSDNTLVFAASYAGHMHRINAATNMWFGDTGAECLLYAESGVRIGAFQVAGIIEALNICWLPCVCDYFFLGEEFLTAGALISKNTEAINFFYLEDLVKLASVIVLIVGIIAQVALGQPFAKWLMS